MPKDLPYYKMYPADAEADEKFKAMSDMEKGFYWRCLNHAWVNYGLPSDPERRARILGGNRAYVDRLWSVVGECFKPTEDGARVVNPRQEQERSKAMEKSAKCTDSVRTRYERKKNVPLRAYESDSDYESEKRKKEAQAKWTDAGFDSPEHFESWWLEIVRNHPNKNLNQQAKTLLLEPIVNGTFKREKFEEGYRKLYESKIDDWTKEGGKYCTNLYEIVYGGLWTFEPLKDDGLTPTMRAAIRELEQEQTR